MSKSPKGNKCRGLLTDLLPQTLPSDADVEATLKNQTTVGVSKV